MATILNDLELLTRDYVGSYSTGTAKTDQVYRAINRAIEYVKREATLPNDQKIFEFSFSPDQLYYDLPQDVMESLMLKYKSDSRNTLYNTFNYFDYANILDRLGTNVANRWSVVQFNGRKQLIVVGTTQYGVQLIESMDDTDGWSASDDASNLAVDPYQKVEGVASLSFDVTYSAGYATLTKTVNATDYRQLFEREGVIKFQTYLTDADVTSISIKLKSGASDYYLITADTDDIGNAFVADEWMKISFPTADAVAVGSPDTQAITSYEIVFNLPVSFVSATEFRIDKLYLDYPEKMELIYLTNIKGTDSTGVTNKTVLNQPDDILWFSDDYDDYADLICQRAAINLWPQMRGDRDQMIILQRDFLNNIRSFTKRNPRRRVQGTFKHSLRR